MLKRYLCDRDRTPRAAMSLPKSAGQCEPRLSQPGVVWIVLLANSERAFQWVQRFGRTPEIDECPSEACKRIGDGWTRRAELSLPDCICLAIRDKSLLRVGEGKEDLPPVVQRNRGLGVRAA